MSGGGRQPAAPDYVGAAEEQGRQNILAAQEQARLNRFNQVNPYGSSVWRQDANGQWTNDTSLTIPQQRLLIGQQENQLHGNRLAGDALRTYGERAGAPISTPGVRRETSVTGVGPRSINTGGLSSIPGAGDFSGERQAVVDALYRQQTNTLDPQFQQQEQQLRERLLNSGITEGTEQFRQQFDDFSRQRTAAFGDARDRAIIGGGQEQSRMLADSLGIRQQQFGEAATGAQFESDAAMRELDAELARMGFFNEAGQQGFEQDITARSIPMSELMSLINMTTGPEGSSAAGGSGATGGQPIAPVDITGAVDSAYGASVNAANQRAANRNANVTAGAGILSAALIAF